MQPLKKDTIVVGCFVCYRLPASQLPIDKNRLWRGKVLKAIIDRPCLLDSVIVQSLEEGYENDTERVLLEHIVSVEKQEETI